MATYDEDTGSGASAAAVVGVGPSAASSAPRAPAKHKPGGWGTVKAVLSGDSLVLTGKIKNPAISPPEKTIILTGIIAPRFARTRQNVDEPFAFQSREFLRNKLIGQNVRFNIVRKVPGQPREFGEVYFQGNNVTELVVRNGWARVKQQVGTESELQKLEDQAKEVGIGIWQQDVDPSHQVRTVEWGTNDPKSFNTNLYEKFRGVRLPAIVDYVRDGSTMRCELLSGSPVLKHTMIMLHLAGAQCPRIPLPLHIRQQQYERKKKELESNPEELAKLTPAYEEAPPKYSLDAKRFTEDRLLHRSVNVVLQGCDKMGNLFGAIEVPQGNIAVLLLSQGFAQFIKWSAQYTGNEHALQQAEKIARDARYRIWKLQQQPRAVERKMDDRTEFTGKVTQVFTGDTICVQDPQQKDSKHDIRVILSSIRAPRFANRFNKDSITEPWAYESKEALRNRLIDKKVRVCVEYRRPAPENNRNNSDRIFATVWQGKQNIAEAQVVAGNASVISHNINEERSGEYQKLLEAEQRAIGKKKGIHASPPPPIPKYMDLSERFTIREEHNKDEKEKRESLQKSVIAKAKAYFDTMKGDKFGKLNGVVEYVFAGHRLKILIPKQNCIISYVLAGIRCDAGRRDTNKSPEYAFAEQALEFTRSQCLQRNVQVDIEAQDRAGNFIGSVFVNKKNVSCMLLEKGLANIVDFGPKQSRWRKDPKYMDDLRKAQNVAKNARVGMWTNYNPEEEAKAKAQQEEEPTNQVEFKSKVIQVTVSDIRDAATFYIQIIGSKDLEAIENRIKDSPILEPDAEFKPQKGKLYLGQFQGDWYRCKNLGYAPLAPDQKTRSAEYRVHFVDYGNEDIVALSELREIDDDALLNIPFQSRLCTLAGIRGPPQKSDYVEEAAMVFNSLAMGRPLAAQIEIEERDMLHVTLMEPNAKEDQPTVNQELARGGWVRPLKYKDKRLPAKYRAGVREDVDTARRERLGIWVYGDCGSDTEERM